MHRLWPANWPGPNRHEHAAGPVWLWESVCACQRPAARRVGRM